jgi:Hypervirulence associated proteins TUDOR domain
MTPQMTAMFKVGDHVRWNSEAGRVSGVIIKEVTSDTRLKGYIHHASKERPQYLIKSDKTDHVAIHKGTALRLVTTRPKKSSRPKKREKEW